MDVLLVGLGRWGEQHLRVLREIGVTVWAADPAADRRAWAVGQGLDARRVVADGRTVLGSVDAVDIVTPADRHQAVAEACLTAGRPCFVEKPLATTAAAGRRLAALARETGRLLQVGHIFRFHPVTVALGDALASGRIGAIRYATGRLAGFKRPRTDVGVTQTDALHYVDLFAHLLGRPATTVAALQRDFLGRGLDDMSVTVVEYGEVPALVEANYFAPGTWRECLFVGERGSLVADFAAGSAALYQGEHRRRGDGWEAVGAGKEPLATTPGEPLRLELEAFLDACAGRRPNPVPAEDGVRALEVVEAAALSARLGRTVRVEEVRQPVDPPPASSSSASRALPG
jgi:predicted dehydrogenase